MGCVGNRTRITRGKSKLHKNSPVTPQEGGREGMKKGEGREGWMQHGEEKQGRREGGQESRSVGWWEG